MNFTATRRAFLRSASSLIALPAFASLGSGRWAAAAPAKPPKRLVFLNFGWGVTEDFWYPNINQTGTQYDLSPGLKPLARHQADFTVVQGTVNKFANEGHWGSTLWLTGANRYAQPGQSFTNSISADQVAAGQLGRDTRFPSLQVNGAGPLGLSGHGPGLSLAWDVRGKPLGGQNSPLEAYHRLFTPDNTPLAQQQAMLTRRRSVLDAVRENAQDLKRHLNSTDNHKLGEYFESIRDIELRLSREEQWLGIPQPKTSLPEPKPSLAGREEIQLMYDIFLAAMQTDSTRIFTYRQPVSTLLTSLDISVHPHDMSHYHTTLGEKLDASQRRDLAQSELLSSFIDKLKRTPEADGSSLFDHVTIAYGSNLRTGHNLDNCPTLLAGRGAGIRLGQHLVLPKGTPLCNVWLTLLQGSGVQVERHGDSTDVVRELMA